MTTMAFFLEFDKLQVLCMPQGGIRFAEVQEATVTNERTIGFAGHGLSVRADAEGQKNEGLGDQEEPNLLPPERIEIQQSAELDGRTPKTKCAQKIVLISLGRP